MPSRPWPRPLWSRTWSRTIIFDAIADAKFVQFLWKTGYATSWIGVSELQLLKHSEVGAVVTGVSSSAGSSYPAEAALDVDTSDSGWLSAVGQVTDQWIGVMLPGEQAWLVDHVALQRSATVGEATDGPRDFEVWVSGSASQASPFSRVYSGTVRNDGTMQHFVFPKVAARLREAGGAEQLGGASYIRAGRLPGVLPQIGAVAAIFTDRSRTVDAPVASWTWDFGDGASASAQDVAHTFPGPGLYDVKLSVVDENGLASARTIPYRVYGAPQVDFSWSPLTPNEVQIVSFVDESVNETLPVAFRQWTWGDGTAAVAGTVAPKHTYADSGTFDVSLRLVNVRGNPTTVTKPVTVANVPPIAEAGAEVTRPWGLSWTAAATVGDVSSVDARSLVCDWDFRDGGQRRCRTAPARLRTSRTSSARRACTRLP